VIRHCKVETVGIPAMCNESVDEDIKFT
jgi:hypothetical protein